MSDQQTIEATDDQLPVENAALEAEQAETTDEVAPEEGDEESATSEDDDAEQGDEDEGKPRKSRARDRINELTREKYEQARLAQQLREQNEQLMRYLEGQMQQRPADDMPKLADYDYDENRYSQAVQAWYSGKMQESQQQAQRHQEMMRQQAEEARAAQAIQQKLAAGTQKYPDFAAKVQDPNLPPLRQISPAAFQAVMESDVGIDVAYYLASNPEEIYSLGSMNPVQAVRKVAQIEAKLASKPAKSVSPGKPPTRLRGNSDTAKDPEKMTTSEWLEWRNAQILGKQR